MEQQTKKYRAKTYLMIIGIVTALSLAVSLVSTWLTYPSPEHRKVMGQVSELSMRQWTEPDFSLAESNEYKVLENTAEFKFSRTAEPVNVAINLIVYIALVGGVYNYIRKNNLSPSRRAVGLTVVLCMVGSLLAAIIGFYPAGLLMGVPSVLDTPTVIGVIIAMLLSLLITFVVAAIFEHRYNKRHSFLVE